MSEKAKQSSALMDKFFECELAPSFIGICVAPFVASASPVLGTALALGATALGCIELKDTIRKSLDPNREKIQKLFENVKFCNSKGEYPKLLKSYKNEYYYFDLPDAMDKRDIMKLKGLLTTSLECDDIRFQINEKPYFMRVIHDKQYGPYSDELFRRVTAPNGEGEYIKIKKVDTSNPYFDLVYVDPPLRVTRDVLEKLTQTFSSYFRNEVEFHAYNGVYFYKIFKNHLKTTYEYQLGEYKISNVDDGLQVLVGFSKLGMAWINLSKQNPHIILAGCTGSGKSTLLHSMLCNLIENYPPERLNFYLADFKEGIELQDYEDVAHVKKVITDINLLEDLLLEIDAERARRNKLFSECRVRNLLEYNKKFPDAKLPYLFLVIDEVATVQGLAKTPKAEVNRLMAKLGQLGRSSGVHVLLSTQRPDKDVITPLIKTNFNNRICLAVEDDANSEIILGSNEGKYLRGNGHGILKYGRDRVEFQGFYLDKRKQSNILSKHLIPKLYEGEYKEKVKSDAIDVDTHTVRNVPKFDDGYGADY